MAMLASGAGGVEDDVVRRRHALAVGWGALGATLLMAVLLGVRRDLAQAIMLPMFWAKLAYVAALAAAGVLAAVRLSIPGGRLGKVPLAIALAVGAMWLLAAIVLAGADAPTRRELFFGATWRTCPLLVALLASPVFVAVAWAMRGLAPTRLRLAGTAAGFAAGGVGALIYSLHCPELAAPFLGFWYLLGVLIPTLAGAVLGPPLFRW